MMRVNRKDKVKIISGKDKGKDGKIIAILPKKGKIKVEGVAIVTRHIKSRRDGDNAGIRKEESFIPLSNVMPICPSCKIVCRVKSIVLSDGKKVRVCGKCKEVM